MFIDKEKMHAFEGFIQRLESKGLICVWLVLQKEKKESTRKDNGHKAGVSIL